LHRANAFVGEPALRVFLFALKLSVLNKVNTLIRISQKIAKRAKCFGKAELRPLCFPCTPLFERLCRRAAKHNLFVWELMKASWPSSPRLPRTFHYRGNGEFMISGQTVRRRSKFLPQNV
jgi:hypothetical protein